MPNTLILCDHMKSDNVSFIFCFPATEKITNMIEEFKIFMARFFVDCLSINIQGYFFGSDETFVIDHKSLHKTFFRMSSCFMA